MFVWAVASSMASCSRNAKPRASTAIRCTPEIPRAGEYEIFFIFPPHANRASNVPVTVTVQPGVTKTVHVNQKPGAGNEIQLTDGIRLLLEQQPVYAYMFEGTRYDAGDKLGFLKATVEFALRREDLGKDFRAYLRSLKL